MKEKLIKLKELWKIPRYHALMVLGLYAIFFLIIFLIIIVLNFFGNISEEENSEITVKTTFQNYIEMESYEYTYDILYKIGNNEYSTKIEGIKFNNNKFKYLNNYYYIENNKVLNENKEEVSITDINLIDLEPINIEKLLNNNKEITKTIYKDNTIKKEYKVIGEKYNLYFVVYEKDNFVNKIEINAYELIKLKNNKISAYNIEINYKNINNIVSYD